MKRDEIETKLADVRAQLDGLPPSHQAEHRATVTCRRAALMAYAESLEMQLSTAIVQEQARAVEKVRHAVHNSPTSTSTTRGTPGADSTGQAATVHSSSTG